MKWLGRIEVSKEKLAHPWSQANQPAGARLQRTRSFGDLRAAAAEHVVAEIRFATEPRWTRRKSSPLYEDSTTYQTCARLCSAPAAQADFRRANSSAPSSANWFANWYLC